MPNRYVKYIVVPLAAFVVTYFLVPWVRRLASRYGFMDQPDQRRIHENPTPRAGGLAVFIGFHAGCAAIFFLPWGGSLETRLEVAWWFRFLLVSSLLLIVGLIDDRYTLRAGVKLVCQVVVAGLAYYLGFRATTLLGVELSPWVSFLFSTLWILGAINAFNLIDGMDGLASGLAIVAALSMMGQSLLQGFPGEALVALALIGACLAFLRYNFHPASIFLGDGGSMLLGLSVAILALKTSAEATTITALVVPLLAVGVPAFDVMLAIWRRAVRHLAYHKNKKKGDAHVFGADTDHLHHRLRRSGLSQRRVAGILYAIAAALMALGFLAFFFHTRARGLYFITFLGGLYLVVRHLAKVEIWETGLALMHGLHRPQRKVLATLMYPAADLLLLSAGAAAVWWHMQRGWLFQRTEAGGTPFLGLWLALPFLTLILGRTYQRVWSMARPLEYVCLWLALAAGSGLAAVATSPPVSTVQSYLLTGINWVLFMALCGTGMISLRAFPRLLRDGMTHFRWAYDSRHPDIRKTLLCGKGASVAQYLRVHTNQLADDESCERIIGLICEDTNLHGRRIGGHPVLGGSKHLPQILRKQHPNRIVLLDDLPPERLASIQHSAWEQHVQLCIWSSCLTVLEQNENDRPPAPDPCRETA